MPTIRKPSTLMLMFSNQVQKEPEVEVLGDQAAELDRADDRRDDDRQAGDGEPEGIAAIVSEVDQPVRSAVREIASRTEAQPGPGTRPSRARPSTDAAVYKEGERNDLLYHLASQYRRHLGLDQEELEALLTVANAKRCQPPLPEAEVSDIARSAATCPHECATARSRNAGRRSI
jgi:Primase C terminal 1 (PriCT-1)